MLARGERVAYLDRSAVRRNVRAVAELASYVLFEAGGTLLAIEAAHVEEVVEAPVPTPVPMMPRHLLGLTAHRGRALAVVDLAALLDLRSGSPPEHALVVSAGGLDAALLCDRIRGFSETPAGEDGVPVRVLPATELLATAAVKG